MDWSKPDIVAGRFRILIEVSIDVTGKVTQAEVVDSCIQDSQRAEWEFAAAMVKHWKFQPATRNGVPVESRIQVPLVLIPDGPTPEKDRLPVGWSPESKSYGIWGNDAMSDSGADSTTAAVLQKATWPTTEGYNFAETIEIPVEADISEKGDVTATWITLGPGRRQSLIEASRRAAMSWAFSPATKDGEPVSSKIVIPFEFSVGD